MPSRRCSSAWARRSCIRAGRGRPAHQDGQPDPDRREHGRACAKGCCTATRRGWTWRRCCKSVSVGAAGSKALEVLGPRMLERNFEPGFYVEHFIKDMGIALAEAETHEPVPAGPGTGEATLRSGAGQGYGRKGTQALMLALENMNAIKR